MKINSLAYLFSLFVISLVFFIYYYSSSIIVF